MEKRIFKNYNPQQKVFNIGGKNFVLCADRRQIELIQPILDRYNIPDFKFDVDELMRNPQSDTGQRVIDLMDRLVKDLQMVTLLACVLVEKGKQWNGDDAKINVDCIGKISFFGLINVFVHFITEYLMKADIAKSLNQN